MSKVADFIFIVVTVALIFCALSFSYFLGGSVYSGKPMQQLIANLKVRLFGDIRKSVSLSPACA